jgi:hypothetical protein
MEFPSRIALILALSLLVPSCAGDDSGPPGEVGGYATLGFDYHPDPYGSSPAWVTGSLFGFGDPDATEVTWANITTGSAGSGGDQLVEVTYWFMGYTWTEIVHKWAASIPLVIGPNTVAVTASDTQGRFATATTTLLYAPPLPEVRIVQPSAGPTYYTTESPLLLSGTAFSPLGLFRVEWANDLTGASGAATGTTSWEATVPLGLGTNPIRITAVDTEDRSASASITVEYPATNPMPTVTMEGPSTTGTYTTADAAVLVYGDSSSPFGIDHVDCVCSESAYWSSSGGTTLWNFWVPLAPGTNTVQVTAVDGLGGSTTITLIVTRTP